MDIHDVRIMQNAAMLTKHLGKGKGKNRSFFNLFLPEFYNPLNSELYLKVKLVNAGRIVFVYRSTQILKMGLTRLIRSNEG